MGRNKYLFGLIAQFNFVLFDMIAWKHALRIIIFGCLESYFEDNGSLDNPCFRPRV